MLGVVSPGVVKRIHPISRSIGVIVVVIYEVVVPVDIDIVASPSAAPAPASAPTYSYRDGGAVPYRCATVISSVKGRIWVVHCTPNKHRVIRRHIDHLTTGLFNHDDSFAFNLFRFHLHLLIGLQLPG